MRLANMRLSKVTVVTLGMSLVASLSLAMAASAVQRAFLTVDEVLRAEPLPSARAIGRVRAGDRVLAGERRGFWRSVETSQGGSGWVRLSALRVSNSAPAAGLAAVDTGRGAAGNVVLTSGTRGVPGRNAPLTRATLKAARPDLATAAKISASAIDPAARNRFVAEGGLQLREVRLPLPVPTMPANSTKLADPGAASSELAAILLGVAKPVSQAELQAYVTEVGQLLADRLGGPAREWRFVVLDSPSVAAFALPDGLIMISRGFFELLESEDELAAVLAREMAHVYRQHHLRQLRTPIIDTYLRPLDPALDFIADEHGARLAARAGYDSSALVTVFERVAAAAAHGADVELLRATTPSIADRIATLADAASVDLEPAARVSAAATRITRYKKGKP